MERITREDVTQLAEVVSDRMRDGLRVEVEGRNGYFAVDLYDRHGMVRTLPGAVGTKREVYLYLRAMRETFNIIGRD